MPSGRLFHVGGSNQDLSGAEREVFARREIDTVLVRRMDGRGRPAASRGRVNCLGFRFGSDGYGEAAGGRVRHVFFDGVGFELTICVSRRVS